MLELIKLRLLCSIAQSLNPSMTCDPQTLLSSASCFSCLSPGMLNLIQVQLLCEISSAIGGGSGTAGFISCGVGPPVAAPAAGCGGYVDTSNDAFYLFRNGAWILKA
jgi:hypothetical protein